MNAEYNDFNFDEILSDQFTPLDDLDNRFLVKKADRSDKELRDELARYATQVNEGNEYSAAVTKTREGGPHGTIVHDTVSGREFAVIAYRSLDKNYPESMPPADPYISTNYTIGELSGGEMIGTPADAMTKLGLHGDLGFPIDNKSAVANDELWWISKGFQNTVINKQKESRMELVAEGAKVGIRSIIYRETRFDYGMEEYLDEQKMLVDSIVQRMVHHRDSATDSKLTQHERNDHDTRMWETLDSLNEQRAHVLLAITSPEKFVVDDDKRIKPADGVDLANRYAQTSGDKMTALDDINGINRVGRVSDADMLASTVIQEKDIVLSAIKVKQFGSEADTNIYAIETPDGQSWIRAERVDEGELRAVNGEALKLIDINANKLRHGGDTPAADVVAQIMPEALRENIAKSQIADHKTWLNSGVTTVIPKTYAASDYVHGVTNKSISPDEAFHAARELLAARIDNRFTVSDLDKKQVARLEQFGLIPESDKPFYSNIEYLGGAKGFLVVDHSDSTIQVIGQHLIERTDPKDPSIKEVQTKEFDLALKPGAKEIRTAYDGLTHGNILLDIDPMRQDELLYSPSSHRPVMARHNGRLYESDEGSRWLGADVISGIARSADVKTAYDPKIENNFGMDGPHPARTKIESLAAEKPKVDASVENTVDAPAVRRPKI